MADRRTHVIAVGVFLAATLAMFADVLLAGNTRVLSIPNDDITRPLFYSLPFGFGELRHGHLVLWNPHTYAGIPFLGAFGHALLYPPHWLHMVLPTAVGINAEIALHVFLSGVWVYLWTSYRRLHPAACVLAGLVFMFCGACFLQIYRGHLHCLITLTWAPLIFLAVDGTVYGASLAWPVLGMAAVAMQIFAGHVQYTFYTAIIAGLYACAVWLTAGRRLRSAAALAAIYAGGASLAAVQLLTGMQAAAESYRTSISYDVASSFAFPPENLLTLILPGLFGDMVTTEYWGRWTLTEMSLFIGVAPFLLAVCGLVHGDKRVKRFSFAMAVIVMILAVGDYTPLFRILYDHVPGFQNFRGTTKFTFLAILFTVMLVAVGFDYVLRAGVPRWLAAAALAAGGVLIAAGAIVAADCNAGGGNLWRPALQAMQFFEDAYRNFVEQRSPASMLACGNVARSLWIGGATFAVVGALSLAARTRRPLVYAIAAIGVLEVMAHARALRPTFDPRVLANRSATLRRLLDERGGGDARLLSHDPYSYVAMGAGALDLWGAEPSVLGRYARFVASTQKWPMDAILVTAGFRHLHPLYGMLRLRYVLDISPDEQVTLRPAGLRELPRALLVPRWKVLADAERVLEAMAEPAFDPSRVVFLERDPGLTPTDSEAAGEVNVRDVSTETIEITADVPQPSILLVTDNYSASWRATPLDGSVATMYEVMPANYLLRAIPLSAGHHHLRLDYRPSALRVGAWVTILTLAACAAILAIEWRRVRRRRDAVESAPSKRRRTSSSACVLIVACALGATSCRAAERGPAPPPPVPAEVARGVKLTKVVDGLAKPVALTVAPGDASGRLFVVEKIGRIRILDGERLQPAASPFLDVQERVSTWTEQGLLGLAFHPDYAHNRRFYVNLTDRKGDTHVLELETRADDPGHADPASEREILFVDQPYKNHNGGHLTFGPDGRLYVGLGDGGSAGDPHGNGQNDRALLAKMLRIDVDEGRDTKTRPRPVIVAKGLRNPWRYSFDRATGDLWIADVGQNRWEEVDVLPAAALARAGAAPVNFGWNLREGAHCFAPPSGCKTAGLVEPLLEYGHDEGCSITGGFVYRGRALPALTGAYFYADYCTALVRSVRLDARGHPSDTWEWRPALDPESRLANLSSFGEDAAGELYLLSLDGTIYRFDPAPVEIGADGHAEQLAEEIGIPR